MTFIRPIRFAMYAGMLGAWIAFGIEGMVLFVLLFVVLNILS